MVTHILLFFFVDSTAILKKLYISVVMVSVVDRQREILLNPIGTNVWSGQVPQSLNSAAVTWSLAKELYGFNGPYWIVPLSLVIGMVPTTIQWLISKVCIFLENIKFWKEIY